MGLFNLFSGGLFDFNGDGKTDASELALGFMMLDNLAREERERQKREFVDELLLKAAIEGITYSDKEIAEALADSERLGLFG